MKNKELNNLRVVILHNIISPYKTLLFNALNKVMDDFKVLYISETEHRREWVINKDELRFPYEVMFKVPADEISAAKLFKETLRRLNRLKPEILIIGGYSYASCWAGFFWAKFNRKKIILWSASNEEDRTRLFIKEKIKSIFIKNCDAANVYGIKSKEYIVKLGMNKNRIFIKGNTSDNAFYYNETMKQKVKRKLLCDQFGIPFRNFLYIGRFSPEKNILTLLEAYRRLKADGSDWGLILVGNGPQKSEVESYIQRHSIKDVFLPGFKQKEEIPVYLAVSDVFILPSISEPWGLVVNEAMAAGLPVLVSKRCGCYPDLIKEGFNGFSFDPFNIQELYILMKNVVEGKYDLESMGKASLDIIKDYTPENAAKIIVETIKFVINSKK